jgi:hypothetical protein
VISCDVAYAVMTTWAMTFEQMELMEAELTKMAGMETSWDGTTYENSREVLTIDFDHFYRFWTNASGNYSDPVGFCDLATVRPIWQAASARKSTDYIGESQLQI